MTEYKIESGIAIPERKRGSHSEGGCLSGAICLLKVGESIFRRHTPGSKSQSFGQAIVSAAGRNARKKFPERRFATRVVVENGVKGVRIWRIADAKDPVSVAAE